MSESSTGGETGGPASVVCLDQLILDLSLVDIRVSDGALDNTEDGTGWTTALDASAGGFVEVNDNPWLYLRFTQTGLEKLDLDDIEALDSDAWHLAAKRFGIRLNSGTSGLGDVQAAAVVGITYDDVGRVPATLTFAEERFYTDDCQLVDDGTGLGSPAYQLAPWWTYPGCVATTGTPFVIALGDGRRLKFVVEAYYGGGQEQCNIDGMAGTDAGQFAWRWEFLD